MTCPYAFQAFKQRWSASFEISSLSIVLGEIGQWLVEHVILHENTLWQYI